MKRLHSEVKQHAMVTHDVAPMPPIDTRKHCHHAVLPIESIANSFFRGCRGDVRGHRLAPLAVLIVLLMMNLSINPVYSQTTDAANGRAETAQPETSVHDASVHNTSAQNTSVHDDSVHDTSVQNTSVHDDSVHDTSVQNPPVHDASVHDTSAQNSPVHDDFVHDTSTHDASIDEGSVDTTHDASISDKSAFQKQDADDSEKEELDANGTLSADDADIQRVRKFSRFFPPQIRKAIVQSRQANRKGPLMVFRHWAQERKPFVASFLFCLFIGLLGSAFFPNQVSVAQECCRSQFWKCLGKAILVGMTLIATVRILDLLMIANPLTTLLLALLELVIVAGLAVGVSLIGEGVTRNSLDNSDYFKTHPRLATFTKICLGSLILAIVIQIPGAGLLPRIGIRIALLVAILGAGGLLKTKFGTQREAAE